MSRDVSTVLAELLALTPPGAALPHDNESAWSKFLQPTADAVSTLEAALEELLVEIDPAAATVLLPDYERVLGPDPYGRDQQPLTIAQQQALAYSRWTTKYGVRPADFIALAATLGIAITITEYRFSQIGDAIGDFLTEPPTQFIWVVNMPSATEFWATAGGSGIGNYLSYFQPNDMIEALFEGRAPAHTDVVFNYS